MTQKQLREKATSRFALVCGACARPTSEKKKKKTHEKSLCCTGRRGRFFREIQGRMADSAVKRKNTIDVTSDAILTSQTWSD